MTIHEKLSSFYAKYQHLGYIPSTVGVSDEEYVEYEKLLKETADNLGLVFTDKPSKLYYKGIELKKYGPRNK